MTARAILLMDSLIKYARWQIEYGDICHPTLPSCLAEAEIELEALKRSLPHPIDDCMAETQKIMSKSATPSVALTGNQETDGAA